MSARCPAILLSGPTALPAAGAWQWLAGTEGLGNADRVALWFRYDRGVGGGYPRIQVRWNLVPPTLNWQIMFHTGSFRTGTAIDAESYELLDTHGEASYGRVMQLDVPPGAWTLSLRAQEVGAVATPGTIWAWLATEIRGR